MDKFTFVLDENGNPVIDGFKHLKRVDVNISTAGEKDITAQLPPYAFKATFAIVSVNDLTVKFNTDTDLIPAPQGTIAGTFTDFITSMKLEVTTTSATPATIIFQTL